MASSSTHFISAKTGWAIGTTLAVSAQFVGNLGTVLQRRSHIDDRSNQPLLKRPVWLFGLLFIALASVSDFAALNFTTQSMLGGIGSLTLVANTIFAPLIAEEVLTWTHVWATLLIVVGCSMVVAYGPHSSEVYTSRQLFDMLASPGFILFMVFIAATGYYLNTALNNISKAVETRAVPSAGPPVDREAVLRAAGVEPGVQPPRQRARRRVDAPARRSGRGQPPFVVTESGMVLDYSKARRPWTSYHTHRVGFAIMSAIFGSMNVLFAKILSQVMASAVFSTAAFYEEASLASSMAVVVLFCIILIAVATVGQMKYINDATQRFEALLVQPIYQACWTLLSVTGGMIVQREWTLFADARKGFLFFMGIGLTLSGALLLSTVRASALDSSATARPSKQKEAVGSREQSKSSWGEGEAVGDIRSGSSGVPLRDCTSRVKGGAWDEELAVGKRLIRGGHWEGGEGGVGPGAPLVDGSDDTLLAGASDVLQGLCDGSSRVGMGEVQGRATEGRRAMGPASRAGEDDSFGRESVFSQTPSKQVRRGSDEQSYDDGAGGIGGNTDGLGNGLLVGREAAVPSSAKKA